MSRRDESGFTMFELLVSLAVMAVVAGVALPRIESSLRESRVQTALVSVVGEMRRARQLAMDRRRTHTVTFTSPRTLTVTRIETGGNPNVQVSLITLPSDVSFTRNSIGSEPDGFSSSGAFTFCGSGGTFSFNPQGAGVDASRQSVQRDCLHGYSGSAGNNASRDLVWKYGALKGVQVHAKRRSVGVEMKIEILAYDQQKQRDRR